ncbi:TMEM175 family protein [Nonomuraea sp. NPDC050536]|uniref:TMEM175 family protein n=1 Tax=Nonomuraea sp. NPDC050536 TaxID=3364366 RepID=UPI0037C8C8BF
MTSEQETEEPVESGYSPERMIFFSDAVFAIAMTLLAIEIERPEEKDLVSSAALAEFLWHHISSLIAFVLGFFLLWGVQRRHHVLMDRARRLTHRMSGWNAAVLVLAAFLPFPTAMIGHGFGNSLAVGIFAVTYAALLGCEAMLKHTAVREGVVSNPAAVRLGVVVSVVLAAFFLLTALAVQFAGAVPALGYAAPYGWIAIPLVIDLTHRVWRRRHPDAP